MHLGAVGSLRRKAAVGAREEPFEPARDGRPAQQVKVVISPVGDQQDNFQWKPDMDETFTDNKPCESDKRQILAERLLFIAIIANLILFLFYIIYAPKGLDGLVVIIPLWPFCTLTGAILAIIAGRRSNSFRLKVTAYILAGIDLLFLAIFIVLVVWH